jgi:hypothetical protein
LVLSPPRWDPGATLVKAFNHLSAEILAKDPYVMGARALYFRQMTATLQPK